MKMTKTEYAAWHKVQCKHCVYSIRLTGLSGGKKNVISADNIACNYIEYGTKHPDENGSMRRNCSIRNCEKFKKRKNSAVSKGNFQRKVDQILSKKKPMHTRSEVKMMGYIENTIAVDKAFEQSGYEPLHVDIFEGKKRGQTLTWMNQAMTDYRRKTIIESLREMVETKFDPQPIIEEAEYIKNLIHDNGFNMQQVSIHMGYSKGYIQRNLTTIRKKDIRKMVEKEIEAMKNEGILSSDENRKEAIRRAHDESKNSN